MGGEEELDGDGGAEASTAPDGKSEKQRQAEVCSVRSCLCLNTVETSYSYTAFTNSELQAAPPP